MDSLNSSPRTLISPLWLLVGALGVSWGWMLPNTNLPWIAFHRDAWVAITMSLIAIVAMVRVREATPWHWLSLMVGALALVPLLQLGFGQLRFAGIAWLNTGFLLGLLLAMLTGTLWARRHPTQAADALFLSVGLAATLSVGMAVYQWLQMDDYGFWILPPAADYRAYANLGQPNQLATFFIWGMLAFGWALVRGYIRLPVAALGWTLLVTGIAITQSRTACLVLVIFACMIWWWRPLWKAAAAKWVFVAMAIYFVALSASLPTLGEALYVGVPDGLLDKTINESRPKVWAMFISASFEKPWLGYGWSQVGLARLTVSPDHPELLGTMFSHSHNLFLDLVLFMGWPLGLLASVAILVWTWNQIRRVRIAEDAVLLMMVIAVGIHAMLELPLHYAYFLLPTGLAIGILNARNAPAPRVRTGRWGFAAVCVSAVVLLGVIVRDYTEIEPNYYAMRFEKSRIGFLPPEPPPDVWALTHMREILRLLRFTPYKGMTEEQLQWMRDVTGAYASLSNLHSLSVALALNSHQAEAQRWVTNMCDTLTPLQCAVAKAAWKNSQREYPELVSISGPR